MTRYTYNAHFSITITGPDEPLIANDVLEPIRHLLQHHLNDHKLRKTIGLRLRGANEEPAVIVGEFTVVKSAQAA